MKKYLTPVIFILALTFSSCSGVKTSLSLDLEEVRPGIIAGYLDFKDLPNSIVLIPPPPKENSIAFNLDKEISKTSLESDDTARWKQAQKDAILYFPEAIEHFSVVTGFPISEDNTPNLYILLRRTLADAGLSTYRAKDHYKRSRPFTVNGKPTCTPEDEEHLIHDGSYPSGHTAIGWAWALILSEVFPEQANQILYRGREFGQSRVICNVHWQSDVNEGRFMGAATVARLHANPTFQADLKAAKKEVKFYKETNK